MYAATTSFLFLFYILVCSAVAFSQRSKCPCSSACNTRELVVLWCHRSLQCPFHLLSIPCAVSPQYTAAEQPPQGMEYTTLSRLVSPLVLARTVLFCSFCPGASSMKLNDALLTGVCGYKRDKRYPPILGSTPALHDSSLPCTSILRPQQMQGSSTIKPHSTHYSTLPPLQCYGSILQQKDQCSGSITVATARHYKIRQPKHYCSFIYRDSMLSYNVGR